MPSNNREKNNALPGKDRKRAHVATGGLDTSSIPHLASDRKPENQTIPVAAGSAENWAITDALRAFRRELENAGIVQPGDARVWSCQYRAWLAMSTASYITDRSPWDDHLADLRHQVRRIDARLAELEHPSCSPGTGT